MDHQLLLFIWMFLSYTVLYFIKNNFTFWSAEFVSHGLLTTSDIGKISSSFELVSATCKLFGGFVVDRFDAVRTVSISLLVCGLSNIFLAFQASSASILIFWSINGFFQALGWPALAKLLLEQYPLATRGRWYSILSASQNAGSAWTATTVPFIVIMLGWQAAAWVPGATSCAFAALFYWSARRIQSQMKLNPLCSKEPGAEQEQTAESGAPLGLSWLWSARLWQVSVGYFLLSFGRMIIVTWAAVMLQNALGLPKSAVGPTLVLAELGSVGIGIVAGVLSDKVFSGRRPPLMVLSSICGAAFLVALAQLTDQNFGVALASSGAVVRVGLYAAAVSVLYVPHMFAGLVVREDAHPAVGATVGGVAKAISQIGSACAGWPIGHALQNGWTWAGVLQLGAASIVAGALVFSTLIIPRSRSLTKTR